MSSANPLCTRYFLYVVLFALCNFAVILSFQQYVVSGDSISYFETGKFLFGAEGGALHPPRILKPLGPAIAYAIGVLTGRGVETGFLVENSLFYAGTAIMVFLVLLRLIQSVRAAAIGSIVYLSSYPLLAYGVAYMTDASSWFFYLLIVYLSLLYFDTGRLRYAFWTGLAAGIGMLFKEYAVAGALFFGLIILFWREHSLEERVRAGLAFLVPAGIIFFSWQLYVFQHYNATYLEWYKNGGAARYQLIDILFVTKSFLGVFLLGWIPAALGAQELRHTGDERKRFLAKLLVLPSISFLLWHVASSRIYFVSGLLAAFLVSLWGEKVFERRQAVFWTLLAAVILVNYLWFIFGDVIREEYFPWYQTS